MMSTAKIAASFFGIGYIGKGGGTVAALLWALIWLFLPVQDNLLFLSILLAVLFLLAGIWSAGMVEEQWGKDSARVVIDEVMGMAVALIAVPHNLKWILIALGFFRFFDIVKPLYIRRAEKLPGGWGVMADDLLAGIYSNICIQLLIISGILE